MTMMRTHTRKLTKSVLGLLLAGLGTLGMAG